MQVKTMSDMQISNQSPEKKKWFNDLVQIVGIENILSSFTDKLAYSRDRWPQANLRYRFGHIPSHAPLAIIMPSSIEEICAIMKLMHSHRQTVIIYGAGSGVLGGTTPLNPDVVFIDMKKLNKVLAVDEISKIATVQGGMNGERFEAYLNNMRLTAGHLPQCLNMSTVAGWIACRGAGQTSSRYGKIEDMVAGIKVVLPNGELIHVRPAPRRATGPGLMDLFIGSEGCLGIIVEADIRVWDYPEQEKIYAIGFKDYLSGLEAFRTIMQKGLRPVIARLYDEPESKKRVEGYDDYKDYPAMAVLTFGGDEEQIAYESKRCLDIIHANNGKVCNPEPVHFWLRHRFESLSAKPLSEGKFMDTIEMSSTWATMPEVYEKTRAAVLSVDPDAHVGSHWSHVYPDGACVYTTFIIDGSDEELVSQKQFAIWDAITNACIDSGGSMAHHHGVGLIRAPYMQKEWGETGLNTLQAIKNVLDPHHILNPGKLALR